MPGMLGLRAGRLGGMFGSNRERAKCRWPGTWAGACWGEQLTLHRALGGCVYLYMYGGWQEVSLAFVVTYDYCFVHRVCFVHGRAWGVHDRACVHVCMCASRFGGSAGGGTVVAPSTGGAHGVVMAGRVRLLTGGIRLGRLMA
jgi:hypothetical protein